MPTVWGAGDEKVKHLTCTVPEVREKHHVVKKWCGRRCAARTLLERVEALVALQVWRYTKALLTVCVAMLLRASWLLIIFGECQVIAQIVAKRFLVVY